MRVVNRSYRSTIWQRAALVRNFVELLATQGPVADVWSTCCRPLRLLMDARGVAIVFRAADGDRIVREVVDDVASVPLQSAPVPHSLAAEVLAANATVIRERADPAQTSIGVPIRFGTTLLGAICVENAARPDREILTLLESCALSAGARINTDAMVDNTARYERLAFTDALTGIANRHRFDGIVAGPRHAEHRRRVAGAHV